jgi:argininosuccinate lyase
MGKLWDKGYSVDKEVEQYMAAEGYLLDQALVKYDCRASIAHAKMLGKIGMLNKDEVRQLVKALNGIIALDSNGKFSLKPQDEDCHTAIENYLTAKLGDVGRKIHTARSRNDQVQAALRLYYKDELGEVIVLVKKLLISLKSFDGKYGRIGIPGYTHTRKAMPSSVHMWSRAFIESLEDDLTILGAAHSLNDQNPLGTGAGYGVPMAVDREYTAKELGFSKVQGNPIYVQNSRGKFESVIVHALAHLMLDLNKMSTDAIMFSMPEFGYFVMPKELTTGSSIMPHKKNPDVLELVRGNYHVVSSYGCMIDSIIGNLPSGYNADLSLTKGPAMRSISITKRSLSVMALFIGKLAVDKAACKKAMSQELYATNEAYDLVKKGVPFRKAYKEIAKKYSK